jgi:hypothetical protein
MIGAIIVAMIVSMITVMIGAMMALVLKRVEAVNSEFQLASAWVNQVGWVRRYLVEMLVVVVVGVARRQLLLLTLLGLREVGLQWGLLGGGWMLEIKTSRYIIQVTKACIVRQTTWSKQRAVVAESASVSLAVVGLAEFLWPESMIIVVAVHTSGAGRTAALGAWLE